MKPNVLRDNPVLQRWVRLYTTQAFPRQVTEKGVSFRRIVDALQFDEWYKRMQDSRQTAYSAIFSEYQKQAKTYDTILYDLDVVDDRAYKLLDKIRDVGLKYRLLSSGHGFHVFLDYYPTHLDNYSKAVRAFTFEFFKDEANIIVRDNPKKLLIDRPLLGNSSAIARLPNTFNPEAGLWTAEIISGEVNSGLGKLLQDFDGAAPSDRVIDRSRISFGETPPCIGDTKAKLEQYGDLSFTEWFTMGLWFTYSGMSKTGEEFIKANAKKYMEQVAEYQLSYMEKRVMEGSLVPPSCKWMASNGLCPFANRGESMRHCDWNPWMALGKRENRK